MSYNDYNTSQKVFIDTKYIMIFLKIILTTDYYNHTIVKINVGFGFFEFWFILTCFVERVYKFNIDYINIC